MSPFPRMLQKSFKSFKRIGSLHSFKKEDLYGRRFHWQVLGVSHSLADDYQYICLRLDWFRLWMVVLSVYCGFALFFAYLTTRLIESEDEHFSGDISPSTSIFEQAFWLSMGHLISIGYGYWTPVSCGANILVNIQFFLGILLSALLLGIVVTKASLPSVKLVFSKNCIITTRNGVRHFMFRVANTRGNLLVAPDIRLSSFSLVNTKEGESVWVAEPLEVVGPPVMAPAFNIVHKITESSPLWKYTNEELVQKDYSISLVATDNHTFQTLYAAKYYQGNNDVLCNVRFSDVLKRKGDLRIMDFRRFNDVEPVKTIIGDDQKH